MKCLLDISEGKLVIVSFTSHAPSLHIR